MIEKTVKESYTIATHPVLPRDSNSFGMLYGGKLLEWIDQLGGIVAFKHANSRVVTASIDSLHFLAPIEVGEVVMLHGWINYVGRTSMEVDVHVEVVNPVKNIQKHACTAYLTYVAIDEDGRPREVPRLKLETEEEKKRFEEGKKRREARLKMREQLLETWKEMVKKRKGGELLYK
ncbi:MAG: acyl-CoA thioesterase [Candidatus Njordarchaeia archaeon]